MNPPPPGRDDRKIPGPTDPDSLAAADHSIAGVHRKPETDPAAGKESKVRSALIAFVALAVLAAAVVFILRPPSEREPNEESAGPPAPIPIPGKVYEPSRPRALPALPTVSRAVLVKGDRSPSVVLGRPEEPVEGPSNTITSKAILPREIARQALLIAARDGLGLPTRDAVLGDLTEAEGMDKAVEVTSTFLMRDSITLAIRRDRGQAEPRALVTEKVPLPSDRRFDFPKLVERAEALSRGEFVQALREAGWQGEPNTIQPEAAVPDGVEDRLGRLTLIEQYGALRAIHAAIHQEGESPQRIGALVRGYAQLGLLTEFHWNASHKALKARSLLYAQRLAARAPRDPWALWHRAFAEALAGLHADALADLAEANRQSRALGETAPRPPGWVKIIETYCRQDTSGLEVPGGGPYAQLAGLLRFLTVENSRSIARIMEVGQALLKEDPECYRVIDALSGSGGVSVQHETTLLGPETLSRTLSERLRGLPGLPDDVAGLLGKGRDQEAIGALVRAGDLGSDSGEPSWSVLGRMIREVQFIQTWRRVRFMSDSWSVPVDEYLAEARPLVAEHPYRNFIEIYGLDRVRQKPAVLDLLHAVQPVDLDATEVYLSWELTKVDPEITRALTLQIVEHEDAIFRDQAALARDDRNTRRDDMGRTLLQISPDSPVALAALVDADWKFAEPHAREWEKTYAQHPDLMGALARRYIALKRPEDAERCLSRYVRLAPDIWAFTQLAELRRERGDLDGWKATLDQFLMEPDYGLTHMVVQCAIAFEFMSRGKWLEARPYAEAAAATGSGDGMLCASICDEGLRLWDESEQWQRQFAERYPTQGAMSWFLWCERTGHGDAQAAERFASEFAASLPVGATDEDRSTIGLFYTLTGEPRKALDVVQPMFETSGDGLQGLYVAMLADALGDLKLRDETLKRVSASPRAEEAEAARFGTLLRDWLAREKGGRIDGGAVEASLKSLPPKGKGSIDFLLGRFLATHGQAEESARYLERCARNRDAMPWMRVIAIRTLRDRGVDLGDVGSPAETIPEIAKQWMARAISMR